MGAVLFAITNPIWGVEFIDENGGGLGVRLRKSTRGQTEKEVTAAAARPLSTS
jgi:hypothetical protein